MDDTSRSMKGFVNPLAFLEVDEPWASITPCEVKAEDVLRFLCGPNTEADVPSIVTRYRQISTEGENRIFISPAVPQILDRLIWPLRHAKGAYALGDYITTIALCGMAAEMTAILIFDVGGAFLMKGGETRPLDSETQTRLFGSTFERLGQERRVKVLRAMDRIDDAVATDFDSVRNTRRGYLHLFSKEREEIAKDARGVFLATVRLVRFALGLSVLPDGRVGLRPEIIKYLESLEAQAS